MYRPDRSWLSLFAAGDTIRIDSGSFESFDGVVDGIDWRQMKLLVSIVIFGRETIVELSLDQVEKT